MLNKQALALMVLVKKIFPIMSLYQILTPPGAWSVWTLGAQLEQFRMGTTKHYYIQNLEALGLVVSDNFFGFPIVSLWGLSVAMETKILIQSAPVQPIHQPNYDSH